MIRSMTGFGRSELKSAHGEIRVEIKTINHKFLEVSSRLPNHLTVFEESVRKIISTEIRRGKISLFVASPDPAVFSKKLVLNEALAKEVFQKIKDLKGLLHLKAHDESAILREVLHYPDVLSKDVSFDREKIFSKELEKAMKLAIKSLNQSRLAEGRALEKDFLKRVAEIAKSLAQIKKRLPALAKEYKKNLASRSEEFIKTGEIDHARLTVEVAQYLKSSDISEEVTRLASHLDAMKRALKESGEVGRKIDFIGQEMTREANTMGAKSQDVALANHVIQIKSTIEKIREQSQNVE